MTPSDGATGLHGRRVLVTGASGFIGSHVVEQLAAEGANVIAAVDTPARADGSADPGWRPQLRRALTEGAAQILTWDQLAFLLSLPATPPLPAGLSWLEQGVQCLVQLRYRPSPAQLDPAARREWELQDNAASAGLAERLLHAAHPLAAVCLASTALVYASARGRPSQEDEHPEPANAYASGKVRMEQQAAAIAAARRLPTAVLRYATVYGPAETVGRAIPSFVRAALRGEPLPVRGPHERRDYVHVRDVARATVAALANHSMPNGAWATTHSDVAAWSRVYNIGSGVGRSTQSVADAVSALVGGDEDAAQAAVSATSAGVVDVRRAAQGLSWRAIVPFDSGLRDEIDWFRARPHLW